VHFLDPVLDGLANGVEEVSAGTTARTSTEVASCEVALQVVVVVLAQAIPLVVAVLAQGIPLVRAVLAQATPLVIAALEDRLDGAAQVAYELKLQCLSRALLPFLLVG
jgi:hypothetical protein